jgi:pyruvate formate lyase activating enzyme
MYEASFYRITQNEDVECQLCPRYCTIEPGKLGNCHTRRNRNGVLSSEIFGKLSAINLDPIEKKPLYHFYPGSEILSMGTIGCNMHCIFCQNHTLSQCDARRPVLLKTTSPDELAGKSVKTKNNIGIAFTYNEPTVNFEFMLKTSELVKTNNQVSVMVSNGYINPAPLDMLIETIDAFNIDLKSFTEFFYKKYSKATLEPVKKTIQRIAKSDKHLEITNLVIPTLNDDEEEFDEMCKWLANETGNETVLHLSRFFPRYELDQYPTPPETLFNLYDLARLRLKHVFIGNMATEIHSNTFCPHCKELLIERTYYNTRIVGLNKDGNCTKCNKKVITHYKPVN